MCIDKLSISPQLDRVPIRWAADRTSAPTHIVSIVYRPPAYRNCSWRSPCLCRARRTWLTQRSIEMVIGRLVTDEEFRQTFLSDPHLALSELLERGTHLTLAEIAALVATDASLWSRVAEHIDPRLQKASLKA